MADTAASARGKARTRIYLHRALLPAPLRTGLSFALPDGPARLVSQVLRGKPDQTVLLFNEDDGEWLAVLTMVERRRVEVKVAQRLRAPQPPGADLWLLCPMLKRPALELVVQKATELGVSRILFTETRRSVADRTNLDRLRTITVEAAEQCERLDLPELEGLLPLAEAAAACGERRLWLAAERGEAPAFADALATEQPGPGAVLLGPEGGFAPDELDLLGQLPFVVPVSLGPRVLRAETAALAAIVLWQSRHGDGGSRPPD